MLSRMTVTCVALLAGASALAIACGSTSSESDFPSSPTDDAGLADETSLSSSFQQNDAGAQQPDSSAAQPKTCDPTCVAAGGTCTSGVCTLVENPGNVDAATQAKLEGGGTADAAFAWLYPYDKTVFARGLLSPTLQFGGTATDATLRARDVRRSTTRASSARRTRRA